MISQLKYQKTKKKKTTQMHAMDATINHLLLFSLLTILLLSMPCPTTAGPKDNGYTTPNPKLDDDDDKCAQKLNRTDFKKRFLAQHNAARKQVGTPYLTWDDGVANYSSWYAEQRRADCRLVHSHGEYGENLFWGSGDCWKVDKIVQAWVIERKDYDHETNTCGKICGHYTQMVWRDTRKLGCAVIVCDDDKGTLAVCNYDPPGNYVGVLPY